MALAAYDNRKAGAKPEGIGCCPGRLRHRLCGAGPYEPGQNSGCGVWLGRGNHGKTPSPSQQRLGFCQGDKGKPRRSRSGWLLGESKNQEQEGATDQKIRGPPKTGKAREPVRFSAAV